MVIRISACLVILGAAWLSGCRSEEAARLCFASRDAFGQNTTTLFCGRDSCYLMQYSGSSPLEGAVGLFGQAVHRDTLTLGDSLVRALMKVDIPTRQQVFGSFSVRRNDSVISIPRGRHSDAFLVPLRKWVGNRRREVGGNPLWGDSLVMTVQDRATREVVIRLASGLDPRSLIGEPLPMSIHHSFYSIRADKGVPDQIQLPADSVQFLIRGSGIKYRVPEGVAALKAHVKIHSKKGSPPLPDACMEGLFELETSRLRLGWN